MEYEAAMHHMWVVVVHVSLYGCILPLLPFQEHVIEVPSIYWKSFHLLSFVHPDLFCHSTFYPKYGFDMSMLHNPIVYGLYDLNCM